MAPAGKPSRRAAAMAAAASARPSAAGELPCLAARMSSASRRPLATMRKPKPARARRSRLPSQELRVAAGRVGEPVAGEVKVLTKFGERGVAGVVVAVEAEIGAGGGEGPVCNGRLLGASGGCGGESGGSVRMRRRKWERLRFCEPAGVSSGCAFKGTPGRCS